MEKKLDSNYTRMLRVVLNKCWRQQPTKQQLCGLLPIITKTIKVRRTRHAGHCWRSKDELVSEILQWTPLDGRPAKAYLQQLCIDTGYSLEDLPGAMDDRDGGERGSGSFVLAVQHEDDVYGKKGMHKCIHITEKEYMRISTQTHIHIYIRVCFCM